MDAESRRTNDPYFLATEAIVSGIARDGEVTTGGELGLAFYFEKRKDTAAEAERMFMRSAPTRWSTSGAPHIVRVWRQIVGAAASRGPRRSPKRVLAVLPDHPATR